MFFKLHDTPQLPIVGSTVRKTKSTKAPLATAAPAKKQNYLEVKIVIAIIGLLLSVVLHELVHVLLHIDQVPHIGLLPAHTGAIVEILVDLPQGYDLEGEEFLAYAVTLLVMLATVMIIFKIHDHADERTSAEILFPNNKEMQKLTPDELLRLVDRADIAEVHNTVKSDKYKPSDQPPLKAAPKPKKSKKPRL